MAEKLAPIEVDPNDKSLKAFFTRARNAALRGMTHDIHADISHDDELTQVGNTAPPNTQHRMHVCCTYPLCYQKGGKQSIFPCVLNVASRQLALVTAVQNSCVLAQA